MISSTPTIEQKTTYQYLSSQLGTQIMGPTLLEKLPIKTGALSESDACLQIRNATPHFITNYFE